MNTPVNSANIINNKSTSIIIQVIERAQAARGKISIATKFQIKLVGEGGGDQSSCLPCCDIF